MSRTVYRGGSNRAQTRLAQLRCDPIGELVYLQQKLYGELQRMEDLRSGALQEINSVTGKPRSYVQEHHFALYDKMITVADKLLRYAYGRVPETNTLETKAVQPLIVNLTPEGEQYKIGNEIEADREESVEEVEDVEAVYQPKAIPVASQIVPSKVEESVAPEIKVIPAGFDGD